jgi:hypothetical protein
MLAVEIVSIKLSISKIFPSRPALPTDAGRFLFLARLSDRPNIPGGYGFQFGFAPPGSGEASGTNRAVPDRLRSGVFQGVKCGIPVSTKRTRHKA